MLKPQVGSQIGLPWSVDDLPATQMMIWRRASSTANVSQQTGHPVMVGMTTTAVASIASSRRTIHVVVGVAGSGKSVLLQKISYAHATAVAAITSRLSEARTPPARRGLDSISGDLFLSNFDRVFRLDLRALPNAVLTVWSCCYKVGRNERVLRILFCI